jgi:hypothetical protein
MDREKLDKLFAWLKECPYPYKYRFDMDGTITITFIGDMRDD